MSQRPDTPLRSVTEAPAARPTPADAEPLDESRFLGMGRSLTFPFPQWRAFDRYRTVFFDEGEGRTLVFIHGLGGNATHWEFLARELVHRYRVVGIDLVGLGWSHKPRGAYTIDMLSRHLLDFLDRRRIERATLIGHSLGGAVALDTALRRPGLVEGLVLMCAAGVAPLPRWMRLTAPALLQPGALLAFLVLGANFIVRNVFVDGPEENEGVRWFRESAMRDAPGIPNLREFARVGASLARDVLRGDYSARFSALTMPVMALWGDSDPLTSLGSVLRRLDDIPSLRTVVLRRCGHLPMVERPAETLEHLERFLTAH